MESKTDFDTWLIAEKKALKLKKKKLDLLRSMKKKKETKKTFKRFERKLVRKFETYLNKIYPNIYTKVDNDSPHRQFKSGWDMLATTKGSIIFFEFKHELKPPKNFQTLMTSYQLTTAWDLYSREVSYWGIVFLDKGDKVAVFLNPIGKPRMVEITSSTYLIKLISLKLISMNKNEIYKNETF